MITDCKWLLCNLAIGLERFTLLDEQGIVEYVQCQGGLFHAIGNGVVNSPHVIIVDDNRTDWGADAIQQLTAELRMQGQLRAGEKLRLGLERLLTDVLRFEAIARPQLENIEPQSSLADVLGQSLVDSLIDIQDEAARILEFVLSIWGTLPKNEPMTAGQLAKMLQKFVKGEYREPLPKEVARELEKGGAPEPVSSEACQQLKGKTLKKWMCDETLLHFSRLDGWRTA